MTATPLLLLRMDRNDSGEEERERFERDDFASALSLALPFEVEDAVVAAIVERDETAVVAEGPDRPENIWSIMGRID